MSLGMLATVVGIGARPALPTRARRLVVRHYEMVALPAVVELRPPAGYSVWVEA